MVLGYCFNYMKIFFAHAQIIYRILSSILMQISFYWTIQQDGVVLLHGLYENVAGNPLK